jgi:hypothetical protein
MPKQVKDRPKAIRMMLVKEAIEKHGKCSHGEICPYVARKIDANPEKESFQRAIRNDIKDLIGDNILGIEYRTRNGEVIPFGEEDKFKNAYNTYYYILGDESETAGAGLFKDLNIHFQPQKLSSPEWKVSNVKNKLQPKKDSVCLLMRINSKYLCLETEIGDLPFTLVVAGEGKKNPSHEELKAEFDSDRVSFISIPDEYLEGVNSEKRLGHFYIQVYESRLNQKTKCTVDYVVDTSEEERLEKVISENEEKWELALKVRNYEYRRLKELMSSVYSFREDNEIDDKEILNNKHKKSLLEVVPEKFEKLIKKVNNLEELMKEAKDDYNTASEEFAKIDNLSCVQYDDVSFSNITYSRVNDFIDDANIEGGLRLPSSKDKGRAKNIGNRTKFHARKPPKRKKVAQKVSKRSPSQMEMTEKFFIWTNLYDEANSELPINVKVGPRFQLLVCDFYTDSSYSQKELDSIYKTKNKKAA